MAKVILPLWDDLKAVQHRAIIAIRNVGGDTAQQQQVESQEGLVLEPPLIAFGEDVFQDDAAHAGGGFVGWVEDHVSALNERRSIRLSRHYRFE